VVLSMYFGQGAPGRTTSLLRCHTVLLLSITVTGVANVIFAGRCSLQKVVVDVFPARTSHARLNNVSHDSVSWLDYSQVAERLGVSPGKVRRLVQERALLAMRVDGVFKVPDIFLNDAVRGELRGTATLLIDGGFSEEEALEWFLRPDDTLGTSPIDAIAQGRKREVRRLAQALAL
jgi:hypothetical protein